MYKRQISSNKILYAIFESNAVYEGYYASITSVSDAALKSSLSTLLNNTIFKLSYGDSRYILDESDIDPSNPNNVLTIYDRKSVSGVWTGLNTSTTFNREHVWPNSRLGVPRVDNSDKNIASDLHNLRAAIPTTNSTRGNKWFDLSTTTTTYFPGDYDKGDVARILFYMVTMYPKLNLVDVITSAMDSATYQEAGMYMANKSVLLLWHIEDPVDDFERNRNEVIYTYQKNRNPFIDHPEFVERIWGPIVIRHEQTSTNLTIDFEHIMTEIIIIPEINYTELKKNTYSM